MRQETFPWWRQAEADFDAAGLLLGAGLYFAAAWFAHQATEKAIEALYVEQTGHQALRVHDLNLLGRHVGSPLDTQRDLALIDPTFGLTRYPNALGLAPVDTITQVRATRVVDASGRVLEWVKSQL